MRLCPTCERPRAEGSKTCSGCGREFPGGLANLPEIVGFGRVPTRARSLWPPRPAAFVAIAIVVIVGGLGVAWLFGGHRPSPAPGPGASALAVPATTPAPSAPAGSPSPAPPSPAPSSPAPSSSANSGQTLVTVAAAARQDPAASSVVAFLDKYFTAINSHHFHAYKALHAAQQQVGLTRASFNSGYQGTIDSAIRLVSISTAFDGDTQAAVKFTSHQTPNAANNQESCTRWKISLFLAQGGSGYLIDQAPPGYHALSAPCS